MPHPPQAQIPAEDGPAPGAPRGLPIWLQILGWFFLNLLLVGGTVFALFTSHSGPVLKALISSSGGDRMEAIASELAERIAPLPRIRWNDVLASLAKRHHAAFALTRRDGDLIAGSVPSIPPEVLAKIEEYPGPPRPGAPPPEAPPPETQGAAEGAAPRPPPPPPPQSSPSSFRFLVHEDGLYWAGVRMPPDQTRGRGPATLLMVSSSLLAGGVLLDTNTLWIAASLLLGSALFWVPLVRRITAPLRVMRDAALRMARGRFDTRVDIRRGDEIGSLANSLNHLGGRLEEFVTGQKRFLGDIAHELGSPLARMQFALSILEQNAPVDTLPLLEDVREEVGQMSELLGELLQFTKAGLHSETLLEKLFLAAVVQNALEQEGVKPDAFSLSVPRHLRVLGDQRLLQRAVANVLRNALRYAANAGPLQIDARETSKEVLLSITDNGPGVPESCLHLLCDPFFRTESARTRETGGVGLGLAIVKRCMEACGGSVSIANRKPHGLRVELHLLPSTASPRATSERDPNPDPPAAHE